MEIRLKENKLLYNQELLQTIVAAVLVIITSVLFGAASLHDGGLPFGVAAVACFSNRKSLNIYFIPFVIFGMLLIVRKGTVGSADIAAAVISFVFIMTLGSKMKEQYLKEKSGRHKATNGYIYTNKAVITTTVVFFTNLAYYWINHMLYAIVPIELISKLVITYAGVYGFTWFYKSLDNSESIKAQNGFGNVGTDTNTSEEEKEQMEKTKPLQNLSFGKHRKRIEIYCYARAFALAVILCGLTNVMIHFGISSINAKLIIFAIYLFYALNYSYLTELTRGIAISATTGAVLIYCGILGNSAMTVVMAGAAVGGLLKDRKRIIVSLYFCAAVLSTVAVTNFRVDISFELTQMVLICIVGAAFAVIPKKIVNLIEFFLIKDFDFDDLCIADNEGTVCSKGQGYSGYLNALQTTREIEKQGMALQKKLKKYSEAYGMLSSMYQAESGKKVVFANQFNGFAYVMDSVERDLGKILRGNLSNCAIETKEKNFKYNLEIGNSAYSGTDQISGDYFVAKEIFDDKIMIMISDGMGKGKTAGDESRRTVDTMVRLLEGGFPVEKAIKCVNSILREKEHECFATMDVGIFDKRTGIFRLYKAGAAATYIKTQNKVLKTVRMSALPLGLLEDVPIMFEDVKLKAGDQILMVTDGVVDAYKGSYKSKYNCENKMYNAYSYWEIENNKEKELDEQEEWLKEEFMSINSANPEVVADMLINKAIEYYGLGEKDDMTALVIKVQNF